MKMTAVKIHLVLEETTNRRYDGYKIHLKVKGI